MGRVMAISGFADARELLYKHAVKLTRKGRPNVLYVGTAGGDAPERLSNMQDAFGVFGCEVRALNLITQCYTEKELDELLQWADLIYVGGGDTITMMRIWREHGLDQRLIEIYKTDSAVLAGVSAGAICWFSCGHSDSESFHKSKSWSFCWANGMLDLFHKAYCPHYNEVGRNSFDQMLKETALDGIAMENGTAFVVDGDKQYLIRSDTAMHAYALSYMSGTLEKNELPVCDLPIDIE